MTKTLTIGVVLRLRDPDVELQMPRKPIPRKLTLRRDWLGNAGREALNGSVLGAYGVQCGFGLILCVPALATVGAIGGAIYGTVSAEPASEWEQAESVFKEIHPDLKIRQRVPDYVVEFARSQTPYRVVRVENQAPFPKGEKAAYRALASPGLDAVLELTELAVYLHPSDISVNPPHTLMLATNARLIRTSDGAVLDDRVIKELSTAWSLTTWVDPNDQAFREEVTQAAQRLAQQVVKELFSDTHSGNDVQTPALQALRRYTSQSNAMRFPTTFPWESPSAVSNRLYYTLKTPALAGSN